MPPTSGQPFFPETATQPDRLALARAAIGAATQVLDAQTRAYYLASARLALAGLQADLTQAEGHLAALEREAARVAKARALPVGKETP